MNPNHAVPAAARIPRTPPRRLAGRVRSRAPRLGRIATLFGATSAPLEDAGADVIAAGVPYDATASSRPGAAEGPLAIRVASRIMAWQYQSRGSTAMYDTRTGTTFEYVRPSLCDVGDLPVYPTDPLRTFDVLASHAAVLGDPGAEARVPRWRPLDRFSALRWRLWRA